MAQLDTLFFYVTKHQDSHLDTPLMCVLVGIIDQLRKFLKGNIKIDGAKSHNLMGLTSCLKRDKKKIDQKKNVTVGLKGLPISYARQ